MPHSSDLKDPPASVEADLVRRAQSGDRAAFAELYHAEAGRVYAVCLRMVADPKRAAELTQDAFVKAWEALGGFREESAFSSWLYRIAVNTVLHHLRAHRRRRARIHPTDDLTAYDAPGRTSAPGRRLDLERGIASLPPGARAVLVLHEIEGYRHDEIAEMMGIAPGTSKAQLHRARQLLKERLKR